MITSSVAAGISQASWPKNLVLHGHDGSRATDHAILAPSACPPILQFLLDYSSSFSFFLFSTTDPFFQRSKAEYYFSRHRIRGDRCLLFVEIRTAQLVFNARVSVHVRGTLSALYSLIIDKYVHCYRGGIRFLMITRRRRSIELHLCVPRCTPRASDTAI